MNIKHLLGLAAIAVSSFVTGKAAAQGMAVNTTGTAAAATAVLDVSSTTQGMLVPRMTQAQRDLIGAGSPATGLLIYQTDGTAGFYFYNGTAWTSLSGGGGAPSGAAGGSLSGSYPNPTIGSAVIANANVSGTAAIAYSKLNLLSSIASTDLAANAVTTGKIADAAITNTKIADSVVTIAKLSKTGAASGQVIGFNGSTVAWTTPSGGSGITQVVTNATATTSTSVGSTIYNYTPYSWTPSVAGTYLISATSAAGTTNGSHVIVFLNGSKVAQGYGSLWTGSTLGLSNATIPLTLGTTDVITYGVVATGSAPTTHTLTVNVYKLF